MSVSVLVAFENPSKQNRIRELLESGGITVNGSFRSGAEIKRNITKSDGGVIICGFKLSDMTSDTLAFDLSGLALILVTARPELLELCENTDLFLLPTPVARGDLLASVRMLIQMEEKRHPINKPRRTKDENELISRAKSFIMAKYGISEPEAHRFIQRASMETGSRMSETARMMLERA